MKKLFSKARSTFQDSQVFPHTNPPYPNPNANQKPSTLQAPTVTDVYRYRYHHGTNLGSIFVLEKWLTPSMFSCEGDSELDAVQASIQAAGVQATREKWESYWDNALSDSDLEWLCHTAKCTTIRLPIGYFTLGSAFCKGTPFERAAEVYEGAWKAVLKLIERVAKWGLGVLVDLHALPGGANKDAHSGSGTGTAEFWSHSRNRTLGKSAVEFIIREVKDSINVVGVQIVNEAAWTAKGMYDWYEDVLESAGRIDSTIPIYISDAWEVGKAASWLQKRVAKNIHRDRNPVIIDTHKYYTFSDEHRSMAPAQIIQTVSAEAKSLQGISVVVGEYSCVLDDKTWSRVDSSEKENYVRQFGQAQSQAWQQNTAGSYFWTLKMDWMDGGEWGFVEQTKKSNITAPQYMLASSQEVREKAHQAVLQKEELGTKARADHENYWNNAARGKVMEHQRYIDGWNLGFDDALAVYSMRSNGGFGQAVDSGADKLGCLMLGCISVHEIQVARQGSMLGNGSKDLRPVLQLSTSSLVFESSQQFLSSMSWPI